MPRVSVLLPVYNGERYLAAAIESVLRQSFDDFELIICDDASLDGSRAIAEDFAARDSRINLICNEKNIGLFANYNRCLTEAQGEIIKPFAQDDILAETIIERCVAALDANPSVALVSVNRRYIDESGYDITLQSGINTAAKYCHADQPVSGEQIIMSALTHIDNFIGEPSTVAFRVSLENHVERFDARYRQLGDLEYWLRLLNKPGARYMYLSETLCDFRSHAASTSNKNILRLQHTLDVFRLARQYRERLEMACGTNYMERVVNLLSRHVAAFVGNETLTLDLLKQVDGQSFDESDFYLFKELAFHALFAHGLGQLEAEVRKPASPAEIEFLEKRLQDLLRSPSWRSTAWLRNLRGAAARLKSRAKSVSYKPISASSASSAHSPSSAYDQTLQIEIGGREAANKSGNAQPNYDSGYDTFLRAEISKVRNSLSWKLTRSLRVVELLDERSS